MTTTVFVPTDYVEVDGMAGAQRWILVPDVDAIQEGVAEALGQ